MRFPLLGKGVAVGVVVAGLVWALAMVSQVVAERAGRLHEAQRSVADSLATAQSVLGPVLQRSCTERWQTESGAGKERRTVDEQRDFVLKAVPRRLSIAADARTEPRYRGIFRVNGYEVRATLVAEWASLQALIPPHQHAGSTLACAAPVLWVAVSDTRGIRGARVSVSAHDLEVRPGTAAATMAQGFQATWPEAVALDAAPVRAAVVLELAGTESLALVPIGEATQVKLASDWPHPSFNGRFLPVSREITPAGFTAAWRLSSLGTRAAQELLEGRSLCLPDESARAAAGGAPASACIESFGVGFIDPVSPYVLGDRATKYGLLFIMLTFVAVGLVEVMRRVRVHPVQYLLVGCALALFFLLLVSLSEHVPFGWAYLVSSSACTALLAFYGAHILRGARAGLAFGAGVGLLYAALYVLLLREQTALVLGATLLFTVLAAVMFVTRRLDWYGLVERLRADPVGRRARPAEDGRT